MMVKKRDWSITSRKIDFSAPDWNFPELNRNNEERDYYGEERENDFPSSKNPPAGRKNGRNRLKMIDLGLKRSKNDTSGEIKRTMRTCLTTKTRRHQVLNYLCALVVEKRIRLQRI